jgi:hypothetical protein
MRKRGPPRQNLQALVLAVEYAELREPYPRLAQLMQSLAARDAGMRAVSAYQR